MGHRLLDNLAAAAHRTHQTPITMRLAVLVHRRMAQIHLCDSPNQNRTMTNKYQLGWLALHDSFSQLTISNAVRHQRNRRIASIKPLNHPEKDFAPTSTAVVGLRESPTAFPMSLSIRG